MYNEVYTSLIVDDNTLDKVAKLLVSKDLQGKIIKMKYHGVLWKTQTF